MQLRESKLVVALAAALTVGSVGCDDGGLTGPEDGSIYSDGAAASATVSGYVWDTEAYWLSFAGCGMNCMLPPLILPASPLFQAAIVPNAIVGLFDPASPTAGLAFQAAAPSAKDGGYYIQNVPPRPAPPFFPVVGTVLPELNDGGTPTNPVGYEPTMTLKPIATAKTTLCLSQGAGVVSDSGVLEAVAKFLTSKGTPTTVADLVDPTKSGGVVVWWLWIPGSGSLRVPAFGSFVTSDVGTSYNISWLPPGQGPPFVLPIQSKRGFYVNSIGPGAPGAAPGVTVTVLPPVQGPPPAVKFTFTDPVTDAASGRPYQFRPLDPLQVGPGVVTFGESQALTPGAAAGAPPDWLCLP